MIRKRQWRASIAKMLPNRMDRARLALCALLCIVPITLLLASPVWLTPLAPAPPAPAPAAPTTTTSRLPPATAHVSAAQPRESLSDIRARLPPSIWTLAGANADPQVTAQVRRALTRDEIRRVEELCGHTMYSSLMRAVQVGDMGEQTFVATGDIDDMWTRDSAVQIGLYVGRMKGKPFLRLIIEGAIRRQAFNIIQDPYANAYERKWRDPATLQLKDRVIGRGGWVATRNYELDSGAYFLTQLYDYYLAPGIYKPEVLLEEPTVFEAVSLMVDTWIVEQHHATNSTYRYFELPENGAGAKTGYTGMTWSGFRPSDDACQYGYLIPANIFAAAALERTIVLNERIWRSDELHAKAQKLLDDISEGIRTHGVVTLDNTKVYAYEVDGRGNFLADFDDANVPSLLSIPLLGWSGYDRDVYAATRKRILSHHNQHYHKGTELRGIGSPHTPLGMVWPMGFAVEALTSGGDAETLAFEVRQSLKASCTGEAMHESVSADRGCGGGHTRDWFEWANALFVVLAETALGERCDRVKGAGVADASEIDKVVGNGRHYFYQNQHHNDPREQEFYQGIQARVKHSD